MASGAWATDYTLTLYADGCSSPNVYTCPAGQQLSVSADVSIEGNRFLRWSDGSTENPRIVTMDSNKTLTAYYGFTYTLTIYADGCETPNVYLCSSGQQLSVSAVVSIEGNVFAHWQDGNTDNPRLVTLNDDMTLTAFFVNHFTVSASSSNEAYGKVSGSGTYRPDSAAILLATAEYGYHFTQWSDGNTENPRTITLLSDTTFTATFAPNTYIISTSATEGGMTKGDTSVLYREPVVITAIPNYGYEFSQWSDGNTNNPRTVYANEDATYVAQFVKTYFQVSVSSDNTTMGTTSGSGRYLYQEEVTIHAKSEFGYAFKQWNDGNTDNPRVLELTQDTSLIAEFAISLYNISLTSNDSTMGSVSGAGVYNCFAPVTITATPKAHCHFVKWSDEVTTNPRNIELSQDTTFTAIFAKDQHVLTILSSDEIAGSVAGGGTFDYDSIVEISATANVGYKFVQWSDGVTTNPRQILIESDQTLTAQFEQCKYQLVLLTSDANAGYVYGGGEFTYSASTDIVAVANEGYIFVDWSDGDTNASRTIIITEDLTLTANFSAIKYTITAEPNDPSMGMVIGAGEYGYKANVQLMAVANAGYEFMQWSNGETNNPYSFVANADLSIVAEFKESSSALEDIMADNNATKVIVDGHVYIIRGNSIYNLTGSKVR